MAAEHAAELSEKVVRVSAARSQQAGLAAALALDPERSAADNVASIDAALEHLRTGAVAPAARADGEGRFAIGDAVGFVDDAIVAWGEPGPTLAAVLSALGADAELLTCIAGDGAPLDEAGVRALGPVGVELECEDGGQPAYWWLVAAE
jgi:dihydroxyacetone kinase-like predicted kinase